ncbi:RNA-directed DNA polymerase, partial [Leptothrix ochracea]
GVRAGGWYLQLDIHNFFNSIHRPTLYGLLVRRLTQAEQRGELPPAHALALRSLCHRLLAHRVTEQVRDPVAAAHVPPHKRLSNAPADCGLPVGNLTSQFFANVYLNELDQFLKHQLKVRQVVRYVDDVVLLGQSPQQLQGWQAQIEHFLQQRLHLRLREGAVLQPCTQGIDFLGYRVFAHHRWVRPRVVSHCRERLAAWHQRHPGLEGLSAADFGRLQALLGSYWGHFGHANSVRLRHQLWADFPWLNDAFELTADGRLCPRQPARWQVRRRQALTPRFFKEISTCKLNETLNARLRHGGLRPCSAVR